MKQGDFPKLYLLPLKAFSEVHSDTKRAWVVGGLHKLRLLTSLHLLRENTKLHNF
jgi:hypothetical protein